MNIITIVLWITIAIIGAITIILVKLHYKGDKLENEEGSILPTAESINEALNMGKDKFNDITDNTQSQNAYPNLSPENPNKNSYQSLFKRHTNVEPKNDDYIAPDVEKKEIPNYEYASQNQILINYDNSVKKFQEPIKQSQMDIMNKNKDNTELKDLFTIDELIKESKRKDDKREKESQTIKKDTDENDLNEIKDSIKNKTPEPLIEEVISDEEEVEDKLAKKGVSYLNEKEELADELLKEGSSFLDEKTLTNLEESKKETEVPSEKIENTPVDKPETTTESEEKEDPQPVPQEEEVISEPILKTPNKIDKNKEPTNPINEEEYMDLDYRKDIDKVKNKIVNTKIFQEVKEKLSPETEDDSITYSEPYTKEVAQYNDEYAPIINETHVDVDATYEEYHDEKLRQENSRRVFNAQYNPQLSVGEIKSKPARDNIKININNSEVVLKKGDEIIFNYDGETYSSKVFAINGDDITVKYRGKKTKIKGENVKKIY